MAFWSLLVTVVAGRAHALPVAPVPEQSRVALVRCDVIDKVCRATAERAAWMVDQPLTGLAAPLAVVSTCVARRPPGVGATIARA